MPDTMQKTLDLAVKDDPVNGVYRVGRDIFTDPEIFELEMKHMFEGQLDLSGVTKVTQFLKTEILLSPGPAIFQVDEPTDQSARPASSGPVV
jgi:hypothetical protein